MWGIIMKNKIIILLITAILAIAAVFWGVFAFYQSKHATFTGTVTNKQLVYKENNSDIKKVYITVRGEKDAKIFEFNPQSELIDVDKNKSVFYYQKIGEAIKVEYDPSNEQTNEFMTYYIAEKAYKIETQLYE